MKQQQNIVTEESTAKIFKDYLTDENFEEFDYVKLDQI